MPLAMSALAMPMTSRWNSAQVTSRHWPLSSRRNITASGSSAARTKTVSVSRVSGGRSVTAGVVYSRTVHLLVYAGVTKECDDGNNLRYSLVASVPFRYLMVIPPPRFGPSRRVVPLWWGECAALSPQREHTGTYREIPPELPRFRVIGAHSGAADDYRERRQPTSRRVSMASSNRDQGSSTEIIDEALRLVDTLQRRLLAAGVRRQVNNLTSPPPRANDVWAEAIRQETEPEAPVADQVLDIARETLPQVGRHLSAAGALLF